MVKQGVKPLKKLKSRYKDKCETCGQVASGEHSGGLFVGEGSSYNAGFTWLNPKITSL